MKERKQLFKSWNMNMYVKNEKMQLCRRENMEKATDQYPLPELYIFAR